MKIVLTFFFKSGFAVFHNFGSCLEALILSSFLISFKESRKTVYAEVYIPLIVHAPIKLTRFGCSPADDMTLISLHRSRNSRSVGLSDMTRTKHYFTVTEKFGIFVQSGNTLLYSMQFNLR
jgi:hypothetical protein